MARATFRILPVGKIHIEAFATLFSRVSLALTPLQKKGSKENRGKAIKGIQGYRNVAKTHWLADGMKATESE